MDIPHEATLLRIFIGEGDRYEHRPLYEASILKARRNHLAGATRLRGPISSSFDPLGKQLAYLFSQSDNGAYFSSEP